MVNTSNGSTGSFSASKGNESKYVATSYNSKESPSSSSQSGQNAKYSQVIKHALKGEANASVLQAKHYSSSKLAQRARKLNEKYGRY